MEGFMLKGIIQLTERGVTRVEVSVTDRSDLPRAKQLQEKLLAQIDALDAVIRGESSDQLTIIQ